MSPRSRILVFLISTPLAALLILGGLLGAARPVPQSGLPHLRTFEDVVSLIVDNYVEDVNVDAVFDGAMRGLADGLDGSSSYLTPEEVRAFDETPAMPSADVGVILARQFYLRVIGVRDGSPADRAGIRTGDFIRAIDDKPTRDVSTMAGTRLLHGEPGSSVSLLVIRGNNVAEPYEVTLVREVPSGPAVTSRRLPGGERYVRVVSFGPDTAGAIRAALDDASGVASPGPGAVIDLRSTADGKAEDAIAAARLFISDGHLAARAARDADPVITAAGEDDGSLTMPVVLLISNGTANAAEIFAAALSGNDRARLVGAPTAGLAGEQHLVRLPGGHGLWITYAQYLQVDGTPIHSRGLRPDVPVPTPQVPFGSAPPETDAVLDRAVEVLHSPDAAEADELQENVAESATDPIVRPIEPPATPPPPPTP